MPCPKDFSRVDSTGRAYAGSQRQIQTFVNEKTGILNSAIAQSLSRYDIATDKIHWVSPIASDAYSEYQDSEFLGLLGLGHLDSKLREFWPRGGPCWDALAQTDGGCIIVEAKSHVPEIYGSGCKASAESLTRIKAALNSTKSWLAVSEDKDWTGPLYQSANRLATLHFLREIAGVRAVLVNVYFVGDPRTPTKTEDWTRAIHRVNEELGIVAETPYTATVFLTTE